MKITITVVVAVVAIAATGFIVLFLMPSSKDPVVPAVGEEITIPGGAVLAVEHAGIKDGITRPGQTFEIIDFAAMDVGEVFSLYLPQEQRIFEGKVTSMSTTTAGNQLILGKLSDGAVLHDAVITVGPNLTFGSLQTNQDRYQFEISNDDARIVSLSTTNQLRDFAEKDYVIPRDRAPVEAGDS